MKGKIVKLTGGFYYVETTDGVIECRARGNFRHNDQKPLVGDDVEISTEESLGYITSIYERKNSLIRPSIANVDQIVVFVSAKQPDFSSYLLNLFLALFEYKNIEPIIVVTKMDLLKEDDYEIHNMIQSFKNDKYKVIEVSNETKSGIEELKTLLKDKLSVFTGQTGVGKSSTINSLIDNSNLETQEISKALGRGKHTTRHTELYDFAGGKVADTPGFSSFELIDMEPIDLAQSYHIFKEHFNECKFRSCLHDSEPKCGIKDGVAKGTISQIKYDDYMKILHKLKEKRGK